MKNTILFVLVLASLTFASESIGTQKGNNSSQESFDYVVTVGNEQLTFVRRPELGYVIKVKNNMVSIETLSGMLKNVGAVDISPIRGLGRKGISIVHSKRPAGENENTIGILKAHSQIKYAAPLFSSNGETVAIIPEIVIRVKPDTKIEQVREQCESLNLTIIKKMEFTKQEYLLEVLGPDADEVFDAVEQLNEATFVEWVCPNTASQPKLCGQVIPNDEYFPMQWHLHNTGQSGGTPGADIRAPEAWEITTGDPNIVVAVIDSGVDASHADLINNLVPGYDFLEDDDSPDPGLDYWKDAHGTACAGLIAAQGNNTIGVSGVAWSCKIMPVRVWEAGPDGTELWITGADIAEACRWAASRDADILSNSWSLSYNPTPIVHSAIVDITQHGGIGRDGKGCVVLFGSGNGAQDLWYPQKYAEVIAVGATDHNDTRYRYSNYGPSLDIVGPSGCADSRCPFLIDLWTTDISGLPGLSLDPYKTLGLMDYIAFQGTSASCPIAAGVAALILSVEPNLTNEEVRHFLTRSAKDLGDPSWDEYYGHGRVDARAAVELAMAARADLNDDCFVNLRDFSKLAQYWMQDEASVDIYPPPKGDGIIDVWDVITMGEYWLREIPDVDTIAQ